MKVYIVYELGYTGCNQLEILGVYSDIDQAKKVYLDSIDESIKEDGFDYDRECGLDIIALNKLGEIGEICNFNMVRLFSGFQENWDDYLEIYIEEQEVK